MFAPLGLYKSIAWNGRHRQYRLLGVITEGMSNLPHEFRLWLVSLMISQPTNDAECSAENFLLKSCCRAEILQNFIFWETAFSNKGWRNDCAFPLLICMQAKMSPPASNAFHPPAELHPLITSPIHTASVTATQPPFGSSSHHDDVTFIHDGQPSAPLCGNNAPS